MADGWVKLYRKLLDSDIYNCLTPEQFKVMITLLLLAGHKDSKVRNGGKILTLHAGEFLTSERTLATRAKLNPRTVMAALSDLSDLGFITRKSTRNGTIVSITNWQVYQGDFEGGGVWDAPPVASPTTPRSTPNQEYKEDKEYISIKQSLSSSLDPELKEALISYIDMRAEKNIPLTQTQFRVMMQNLLSMTFVVSEQVQIVNTATSNGWKNFYKPKKEEAPKRKQSKGIDWEAWKNEYR